MPLRPPRATRRRGARPSPAQVTSSNAWLPPGRTACCSSCYTTARRATVRSCHGLQRRALDARAHVQVALRIRHAHTLLLEPLPDLDQHVALDVLHAVLRVADPKPQLQL